MRSGVMLLGLVLAVSAAALEYRCPPGCDCSLPRPDNVEEYSCSGVVVRKILANTRAEFDCGGGVLECSKLPHLSMESQLDKLEMTKCNSTSLVCPLASLGATGVDILIVKSSQSPVTEETVRGLRLKQLWIYDSDIQRSIPIDAIKTQPDLTKIIITGGGQFQLQPLPPTNLTYLDISSRVIPRLGADLFLNQGQMEALKLWKNQFEDIDVNAFRGLRSLRELDLNGNPIRSLSPGTFHHMPELRMLFLQGLEGRIERLEEGVFSGLQNLEELDVGNAAGVSMAVSGGALGRMPALRTLALSADARALPADAFRGSVALRTLRLNYNQLRSLPDGIFEGMRNLTTLDLSHNMLQNITGAVFKPLRSLTEINLERNHIVVLPPLLFTSEVLEVVNLSRNKISIVHEHTIAYALRLDLSHNRIAWSAEDAGPGGDAGGGDAFYMTNPQSPLSNLVQLRELNLSHNRIARLYFDWVMTMVELRTLDLSNNNLTELNTSELEFVAGENLVVDLSHNQISTIAMYYQETGLKRVYPTLKLGWNPFSCDCRLYDLLQHINQPQFKYDTQNAYCGKPSALIGVPLTSVPTTLLTCRLPEPEVPPGCGCVSRPSMNRTECVCQELPHKLPDPTRSRNIYHMDLTLRAIKRLHDIPPFVQTLNLTNTGLENVPYIPDTVTEVDLTNNRITELPVDVMRRNLTLHLAGNPIGCDCRNSKNVRDLQGYIKKGGVRGEVTCQDGRDLGQVDAAMLCSVILAWTLGGAAVLFALTITIVGLLLYNYSVEVKVWLYTHGCDWLLTEESLDADKTYDVFLSYAHQDEEFIVTTILPKLDKEYKVCVHTRDFIPGEQIREQIYKSVSESRRTLIIFSNNFLNSLWGIEEFRAAYLQGLNDRRVRAVVVLLGDINMDAISDDIKTYISLTTYVKWGDSSFWNKLRYALPRKVRAEDVRLKRRTEVAVEKLSKGFGGVVVDGSANKGFDGPKVNGALNVIVNEEGKLINKGYLE